MSSSIGWNASKFESRTPQTLAKAIPIASQAERGRAQYRAPSILEIDNQKLRTKDEIVKKATFQEQRQECNSKHQENTDNAATDPIKDWDQVVATTLSTIAWIISIKLADEKRSVESAQIHHWNGLLVCNSEERWLLTANREYLD